MFKFLLLTVLGISSLVANEIEATPYTLVTQEITKGKPLMVEVGSISCHACQEMGKLLYDYMQQKPQSKIFFVNIGKEREAAKTFKIQLIPTQIFYDAQGKEVERHIGALSKEELEALLAKYGI